MKLVTATTKTSANSLAGVSMLLLQLLSIMQIPVQANETVLSKKVVPICEDKCYCFGSEGNCPPYPTITDDMIPTFRALQHTNPMDAFCDPFLSTNCVSKLEQGEACVVDLIPPSETTEASCPGEYSYRLRTVPSLENATAEGLYITHTGACGTCSSLEDLALMVEYPEIPYKAQQCFFRSTASKYVDKAVECYEEIGFTRPCATTLAYHQKRIVDKDCGYQCAAWSYDGDLGRPSCEDVSGCGECVERLGITAQLELVAGRTFANSGYPSQKARQCSDITPVSVIGGPDICNEAPLAQFPTEAPLVSTAPATSTTGSPATEPVQLPNVASAAPTEESPTDNATASPVEATTPTQPPVPSLSYQKCLTAVAMELRANSLLGGSGVYCDCSEAESGETSVPKCYSSPDRNEQDKCALARTSCAASDDPRTCCAGCCSTGCDNRMTCDTGTSVARAKRKRLSDGYGGAAGGSSRGEGRIRRRA